ncbi:hypothetical protein QTP88_014791 [Uroleucon formosanum]
MYLNVPTLSIIYGIPWNFTNSFSLQFNLIHIHLKKTKKKTLKFKEVNVLHNTSSQYLTVRFIFKNVVVYVYTLFSTYRRTIWFLTMSDGVLGYLYKTCNNIRRLVSTYFMVKNTRACTKKVYKEADGSRQCERGYCRLMVATSHSALCQEYKPASGNILLDFDRPSKIESLMTIKNSETNE